MRRKALPEGHPDIATSLNNLAALYRSQGRYTEAEPLYREAVEILEALSRQGLVHPNLPVVLMNFAMFLLFRGRLLKSFSLMWRARKLRSRIGQPLP
jgi:Flp pilus assembly protein TadD